MCDPIPLLLLSLLLLFVVCFFLSLLSPLFSFPLMHRRLQTGGYLQGNYIKESCGKVNSNWPGCNSRNWEGGGGGGLWRGR